MKFFYGLAFALYFFEGFIIQYSGASEFENKRYFPDELTGEILAKAGLQTTREMAQAQTKAAGHGIRRIFETAIIEICDLLADVQPQMTQVEDRAETYLLIRSYTKLLSLFEQFGGHARRIHINYDSMDKEWRREINSKIINKYANQLTHLLISAQDDTEIWEEMSNGQGNVRFPNVECFSWFGIMRRKKFDLNEIFPRLKSFTLSGSVADTNCLANVGNLNELNLRIGSIQENQLENIFRKNQQISTLILNTWTENFIKKETLRSIEKLINLKTLVINKVSPGFFNRESDRVYNLSSVTTFKATFTSLIESTGNFSFDMPNLKDLQLHGDHIDNRICDFINYFKKLETVLLNGFEPYDVIECIEQLKYVREFTAPNLYLIQLSSMEQFFENFDTTKSKLKKLMFYVPHDQYTYFEEAINAINNQLRRQNKPTWTFSRGISDFGVNFPRCKINLSLEMQA